MIPLTSISSSTSTNSSLLAKTGIGGLVSGMDIDTLVEQMTSTSRTKITKQQQNLQKLEWKQTAYRSVTAKLKEFQSKYLDVLSSTNFRSTSFFNITKATASSDAVTVKTTGSALTGTITINSVTQLATSQTVKSIDPVSKTLTGSIAVSSFVPDLQAGDTFSLNLDGKVKTITFDSAFVDAVKLDPTTFKDKLQGLVDTAFGQTETTRLITVDAGADNLGTLTFGVAAGSKLTINTVGDENTALSRMGFTGNQSNKINTSSEMSNLSLSATFSSSGTFRINDTLFTYTNTDTLASLMDKINSSSTAAVTISYSSVTDKFTLIADNSGAGENAKIEDISGGLMTALGLSGTGADVDPGQNAILSVDGQPITRSSNTFEVDGAIITLNSVPTGPVTISMTKDATSMTDTIKKFVEDYNSMMDYINGLIKEEADSDYQPLTDEQKEKMSETEIAAWEKKAKSGLLRGDSLLRSISSKLQTAVTGLSVNGFSLYSMGITTSGYTENGKLKIDETKLKTALETRGDDIRALFTSGKGLGNALNDIITDATKTSGVKGRRGSLVDLAGVDNTTSSTENSIYDQIKRANKSIKALMIRLEDEETRLWNKFTAMEMAINNLNSQSSILTSFTSQ